jgi:hypothetical protein
MTRLDFLINCLSTLELSSNSDPPVLRVKKPRRVICWYIAFHQIPKFEVNKFENGENTMLRRTDGKT